MSILDGSFLGSPVHLPHVALCCARQDWCGWKRISNTEEQYWENAAARDVHEALCATGVLVIPPAMSPTVAARRGAQSR